MDMKMYNISALVKVALIVGCCATLSVASAHSAAFRQRDCELCYALSHKETRAPATEPSALYVPTALVKAHVLSGRATSTLYCVQVLEHGT